MDKLDEIPWSSFRHAYGTAEDVPKLLRELRTAPFDLGNDESPLRKLFGNIWHQGTVFEATAYAVPFLAEMAADKSTPSRLGILQLLAEIACGKSFLDVHGNLLKKVDFEEKLAQELKWVAAAHQAVAGQLDALVGIADEGGDAGIAACGVLSKMVDHQEDVGNRLMEYFRHESVPLWRAGYLLLLGEVEGDSEMVHIFIQSELDAGNNLERRAAAISLARSQFQPMVPSARQAIMEILLGDDCEQSLSSLPSFTGIDFELLRSRLNEDELKQVCDNLISVWETGGNINYSQRVLVLRTVFPARVSRPLRPFELSPLQSRTARAIVFAIDAGHLSRGGIGGNDWGLPETKRGWRNLAAGLEIPEEDKTLPVLADPTDPGKQLRADAVEMDQRVLHRLYGLGIAKKITPVYAMVFLEIQFDDEGKRQVVLHNDGTPIPPRPKKQ